MAKKGVKKGTVRGSYKKKNEEQPKLVINPVFQPLFYDNLDDPRYYQVYGGRGCFLENQKVILKNGKSKEISKIKVGDEVKSYSTTSHTVENKKVLNTFKYNSNEYLKIRLKNGNVIKCTPDHKFLYKGEWIEIQKILKSYKKKEYISKNEEYGTHSITLEEIDSYEYINDEIFVYDIEVEDNHSFLLENENSPIIVHNSGKSFTVAVAIVQKTYSQYLHKILYLRQTMSSSEDSTISDIRLVIQKLGLEADFREIKGVITNIKTGSQIVFKGIRSTGSQTAKLKSLSGITTLVIEEAEEVESFDEFSKIDESIRINGKPLKIILIYNPTSSVKSWIHKEWFKEGIPKMERNDTIYMHSTYLDNVENLNASVVKRYEDLKETNPIYYKNTILAEWTLDMANKIYDGWGIYDYFDNYGDVWYGLDFGYGGHDKTSMVQINYFEGVYYVKQMFSKSKLKIRDILNQMKKAKIPFNSIIYADSAMPMLIQEIRDGGYNGIRACVKGNVEAGIKKIQDKHIIYVGEEDSDLFYAYRTFARGIDGKLPHEPDELAALRYGINSKKPINPLNENSKPFRKLSSRGYI